MATILEFRTVNRRGGLASVATRALDASAEIVFFPGVRYERASAEPHAKPKKGKSRRDQLLLED